MKSTPVHIGENIRLVMLEKGITKAELARLLEVKPQSVDYLLKRKSIDTDTMYNVSLVLDFDFSKLYQINQRNQEQRNFDNEQIKAKVLVELNLSMGDIIKLNLKNRVIQVMERG